jgi:hypothetical protein
MTFDDEPLTAKDILERIEEINRMAESQEAYLEYDWGGDGSDLLRPVRAHVEAALVPSSGDYSPPLDQLLSLGDPIAQDDIDERISALGFTQEQVPELVRMTRDRALNTAMSDSEEVWAPIHALTALSQLDIGAYAADLLPLFDIDSDWVGEELPAILGKAGAPALEPLREYIQDRTRWHYGRNNAAAAISAVGTQHPELRDQAVHILSDALEHAAEDDPEVNGSVLSELLHLKAVETLPVIRRAFEQDAIDESIAGDWSEVLTALGQTPDRDDPLVQRSRARWDAKKAEMRALIPPGFGEPAPAISSTPAPKQSRKSKQKNKRKLAAASRKANKKKKRK